jgi:hypothetical protein
MRQLTFIGGHCRQKSKATTAIAVSASHIANNTFEFMKIKHSQGSGFARDRSESEASKKEVG